MTHITLNAQKDFQGICFTLATAPKDISPNTAGKEVGEIRFNPADQKATVSLGTKEKVNLETFLRAGGAIAKWMARNKVTSAAIETASFSPFVSAQGGLPSDQIAFALAEGLLLGSFRFDRRRLGAPAVHSRTVRSVDRDVAQLAARPESAGGCFEGGCR